MIVRRSQPREPRPITTRRQERELFFWTAREALKLVVATAFAVVLVLSLIHVRSASLEDLTKCLVQLRTLLGGS